ncbi:hypothetical protein HDU93_007976, partial [Gonapodya sp. JEL0774]
MSTPSSTAPAWHSLRAAKLSVRDSLIPPAYRVPDIQTRALASGLNDIEFVATFLTEEERVITESCATQ